MPLSDEERKRIEEEVELRVRTEIRVRKQVEREAKSVTRIDGPDNLSWKRVPSYLTVKRLRNTLSVASRSSLALTVILIFGLGLVLGLILVLALLAAVSVGLVWLVARFL